MSTNSMEPIVVFANRASNVCYRITASSDGDNTVRVLAESVMPVQSLTSGEQGRYLGLPDNTDILASKTFEKIVVSKRGGEQEVKEYILSPAVEVSSLFQSLRTSFLEHQLAEEQLARTQIPEEQLNTGQVTQQQIDAMHLAERDMRERIVRFHDMGPYLMIETP